MVSEDLEQVKVKKVSEPEYIKQGIEHLEKRIYIIMRPAAKGVGIVVWSKNQYKQEIEKIVKWPRDIPDIY